MYPFLTDFTQRKRKTYANDLLALSLVSIIVYIYSLGKKFYRTYLKTTEHEMILPYAKPFNEEMREQVVKLRKIRKNMWVIFQHFQLMIWKQGKNKSLLCRRFSVKFPIFLGTPFLKKNFQWLLLTYDKTFLVLVILSCD